MIQSHQFSMLSSRIGYKAALTIGEGTPTQIERLNTRINSILFLDIRGHVESSEKKIEKSRARGVKNNVKLSPLKMMTCGRLNKNILAKGRFMWRPLKVY